jgi:CBS domain-containing protein
MLIGRVCNRDVVVTKRETSIEEAAVLMRTHHVGDLIVVDGQEVMKPIGIVTDRDIVIGVVALDLDAQVMTVGDIMLGPIETAPEDQDLFDTVHVMNRKGIRRMPVVDSTGGLVGIMTVDDALELLADGFKELTSTIVREQAIEAVTRK